MSTKLILSSTGIHIAVESLVFLSVGIYFNSKYNSLEKRVCELEEILDKYVAELQNIKMEIISKNSTMTPKHKKSRHNWKSRKNRDFPIRLSSIDESDTSCKIHEVQDDINSSINEPSAVTQLKVTTNVTEDDTSDLDNDIAEELSELK